MKKIILSAYFLFRYPWMLLLKALFPSRAGNAADPRAIMVLRSDGLGDLVLTIPLLQRLRAAFPGARIDLYVMPQLAGLAQLIKAVDRVIPLKGKGDIKTVREGRYDLCIDPVCTYRWYPAFLCLASGAPVRVGFRGGGRELFFTHSVNEKAFSRMHMSRLLLELTAALGIPAVDALPRLEVGRITGGGVRVAIHPGGRYRSQEWGDGKYGELAMRIRDSFPVEVFFIGAPSERQRLEKLAQRCGAGCGVFCREFEECVPFLGGCSLFIGNNSGPLHLAAALSVSTVSLMGPTDPARFMPLGEGRHFVIHRADLSCSPCGKGYCADHRCLELISVDEVFAAVGTFLKDMV